MALNAIDLTVDRSPIDLLSGYSLEITAKDGEALRSAAPRIPPGTSISVTALPDEDVADRLAAIRLVRELGFEPIPHISATAVTSAEALDDYLAAVTGQAGVRRCFVIAGDLATPRGPYCDSSALIASGALERHGIRAVGVGGHPDGHPHMTPEECWSVLAAKCAAISERGMTPFVVTQFAFDGVHIAEWLGDLRRRGITAEVRLGIPGPAGIKTLLRFAARCGVGASASVLARYGISLGKLLGSAGPDKLVDLLRSRLDASHQPVGLHFYPFGGMEKTIAWITDYKDRT
ncbi:methylenetetrahydrofolate reductase [Sphingobium fuliginis]|jgi:methylenetetrahydrofolate reductase (NADPH)|uniref:methylenetetrahydrofolate reductase (NADH) n=1 Tax=Sphingobium fuliginis (strain ATCC 27551) TaxID=336203 RepID=A0A7M2GMG8_SPHSA|nr:methylenetetrahydrofolate reductase [Sphingobium fuliginis]QOT73956.1 methylenetetrahydrofolate reductase [Sphingobium fuliginis]